MIYLFFILMYHINTSKSERNCRVFCDGGVRYGTATLRLFADVIFSWELRKEPQKNARLLGNKMHCASINGERTVCCCGRWIWSDGHHDQEIHAPCQLCLRCPSLSHARKIKCRVIENAEIPRDRPAGSQTEAVAVKFNMLLYCLHEGKRTTIVYHLYGQAKHKALLPPNAML